MSNLKTAGLAAAGLLVGMLAAVAGAQTNTDEADAPKLAIHYRPSQLESDAGVHKIYSRLQSAAEKVCPQPQGVFVNEAIAACRRQAVAGAVAQIHSSRLAALSSKVLKSG